MSNENTSTSSHAQEQFENTLANLVLDDYLAGPDHEAEPDPEADRRFAQFVIASADDPLQAALDYFADKGIDHRIHEFLAEYGMDATFGDMQAFLAKQNQ